MNANTDFIINFYKNEKILMEEMIHNAVAPS
jgi:hypothetical protein